MNSGQALVNVGSPRNLYSAEVQPAQGPSIDISPRERFRLPSTCRTLQGMINYRYMVSSNNPDAFVAKRLNNAATVMFCKLALLGLIPRTGCRGFRRLNNALSSTFSKNDCDMVAR